MNTLLLLSGDISPNPGPRRSRVDIRDNCPVCIRVTKTTELLNVTIVLDGYT